MTQSTLLRLTVQGILLLVVPQLLAELLALPLLDIRPMVLWTLPLALTDSTLQPVELATTSHQ